MPKRMKDTKPVMAVTAGSPGYRVLANGCVEYHGITFTPSQWCAITAPPTGAELVIAGPGTGKTLVLVHRVVWLVERHGADPRSVLLLTFTVKAAHEMMYRVRLALGTRAASPVGGTFHSQANGLLRRHGAHIDLAPDFRYVHAGAEILRLSDRLRMPREVARNIEAITNAINYNRLDGCPIAQAIRRYHLEPWTDEVEELAAVYEKEKQRGRRQLDHADSLIQCQRLLRHEQVRDAFRDRYRHVLVDEYNDTSMPQAGIVAALYHERGSLLAVGDPEQHIYGFAAARRENIIEFEQRFTPARRTVLDRNFRSRAPIVAVARAVARQMPVEGFSQEYVAGLRTERGGKRRPVLKRVTDELAQAEWIATEIADIRDRRIRLHNVAVLVRHWKDLKAIGDELNRRQIPCVLRGASSQVNDDTVQHFLGLIHWVATPDDEGALRAALCTCKGIGEKKAATIAAEVGPGASLIERLGKAVCRFHGGGGLKSRLLELHHLVDSLTSTPTSPCDVLRRCLMFYERQQGYRWHIRGDTLKSFGDIAKDHDNLVDLLDALDAARDEGEALPKDHVVLATIHSTKGLEWSRVFVANVIDGSFPDRRNELAAERRVFFVGITRARNRLYLVYPDLYRGNAAALSPFVAEMPRKLFDVAED